MRHFLRFRPLLLDCLDIWYFCVFRTWKKSSRRSIISFHSGDPSYHNNDRGRDQWSAGTLPAGKSWTWSNKMAVHLSCVDPGVYPKNHDRCHPGSRKRGFGEAAALLYTTGSGTDLRWNNWNLTSPNLPAEYFPSGRDIVLADLGTSDQWTGSESCKPVSSNPDDSCSAVQHWCKCIEPTH